MKEMWKLASSGLKNNRLKSIFLSLSILCCVCLITSLSLLNAAFDENSKQTSIRIEGDYQFSIATENMEKLAGYVKKDDVKDYLFIYDYGVSKQADDSYIAVKTIDRKTSLHIFPLLKGTMPTKEKEVIVSERYAQLHDLDIGSFIQIPIYTVKNDMESLKTEVSLLSESEIWNDIKITGIYEPTIYDDNSATIDEMIVFHDTSSASGILYLSFYESILPSWDSMILNLNEDIHVNTYGEALLMGQVPTSSMNVTIQIIVIVVSVISIALLYNMYTSALEDQKQRIGMLRSMGMSNTQLFLLLLIKDMIYLLILLPLGILLAIGCTTWILHRMNVAFSHMSGIAALSGNYALILSVGMIGKLFVLLLLVLLSARILSIIRIRKYTPVELILNKPRNVKKHRYHKHALIEKLFGIEATVGKRYRKQNRRKYSSILLSCCITLVFFIIGSMLLKANVTYGNTNGESVRVVLKNTYEQEDFEIIQMIFEEMKQLALVQNYELRSTILLNDVKLAYDDMIEPVKTILEGQKDHNIVLNLENLQTGDFQVEEEQVLLNDNFQIIDENGREIHNNIYEVIPEKLEFSVSGYDEDEYKTLSFAYEIDEDGIYPVKEVKTIAFDEEPFTMDMSVYMSAKQMMDTLSKLHEIHDTSAYITNNALLYGDEEAIKEAVMKLQERYPAYIEDYMTNQEVVENDQVLTYSYFMIIFAITALVLIISMLNMFCIMLTEIMYKVKDILILSSIGIERKQMIKMLFFEHVVTLLIAFVLAVLVTLTVYPLLFRMIYGAGERVIYDIPLLCIVSIFILLSGGLLLWVAYRYTQAKNIVEALKEE